LAWDFMGRNKNLGRDWGRYSFPRVAKTASGADTFKFHLIVPHGPIYKHYI
jgi:hypothetical protein